MEELILKSSRKCRFCLRQTNGENNKRKAQYYTFAIFQRKNAVIRKASSVDINLPWVWKIHESNDVLLVLRSAMQDGEKIEWWSEWCTLHFPE